MPYRGPAFICGSYYHVYNRGAGRGDIFFSEANYAYLKKLVQSARAKHRISIVAYCLMPNHYHFILRQDGDLPISGFIHSVFNAYAQAVNKQQQRTGTLFESRFKHVQIANDAYLAHVCRYVHLNPVKAGIVAEPEHWPHSDYLDWMGLRDGDMANEQVVFEHFEGRAAYRKFVTSWYDTEYERSVIGALMLD